jgi:nucleoside 2-deoxyribosyltransferase
VDKAQHNEDINDKIIAEMRRSKFMVSDFTGHRLGVYFEAGFMLGLGRGVIFTCKEGEIGQAHFDTSHRNHVIWKDAADLREKLKTRIQGTIPS